VSDQQENLARLRQQLGALDEAALKIIAERQALAKEIGRIKAELGRPTRDFAQEREVAVRARRNAEALGLDADFAEQLSLMLIRASLTAQERDRVVSGGEGAGRRVLIIGGAGKMGRWFASFLASQGFNVEIADPSGPVEGFSYIADWQASPLDHDIVIVAAMLRASNLILEELATRKVPGVVFDIGSLKTPLRSGLRALQRAGVAVTSLHPMFGPDTALLSGRHVIFIDLGSDRAMSLARELFAATMATQVEMELDSHDRIIAYILGLSHAVNIVFLAALSGSGEDAERLARLSSTTFDAQLDVASRVAAENPHLYFEIQSLNEHGRGALDQFVAATERLSAIVSSGDENAFTEMMTSGKRYLRRSG
jgi:chorismate mutase / prephenate dehydrogenase